MKYRLIKNAYLTVIGKNHYFNRHFERGAIFERIMTQGDYVILKGYDFRLYVSKKRLKECFELQWENTELFKKSEF